MATERRSTEQRRMEIADAALHLIAKRGIAELSTRHVAEAVGLTTGALFRHFGSLDEILHAVVDRAVELLKITYPPAELPPVERLERFVDARVATVGERLGILRLVLSEQFALALPPEAAKKLQGAVVESRAFLRQAIEEGQRRGEIRGDIGPEVLTTVVMGTTLAAAFEAANGASRASGRAGLRAGLMRLIAAPRSEGGSR
jgi:AcrR family transcriptional regulator